MEQKIDTSEYQQLLDANARVSQEKEIEKALADLSITENLTHAVRARQPKNTSELEVISNWEWEKTPKSGTE